MWVRADLKERAKSVLRKYYWVAFLVTLVASILGGTQGGGAPNLSYRFNSGDFHSTDWNFGNWNFQNGDAFAVLMGVLFGTMVVSSIFLVAFAFVFAFKIFVGGPIEIGMDRYFLEARQDKSDFVNLFQTFKAGRYVNAVKAIAWRELFTFLWTLLLIIPGIVKGYAYSMIPYIMADNPGMEYQRAMKLSMAMTNGQKWDIFVLDLSFLGWALLGMLACCIGVIFLQPYIYATKAELYVALRQRALDSGLCTAEEVGQQTVTAVV
jgi:uncharacterized membrane protein